MAKIRSMFALAVVALLLLAGSAQANVIYSEDFEAAGTDVTAFGYTQLVGSPFPVGPGTYLPTRTVFASAGFTDAQFVVGSLGLPALIVLEADMALATDSGNNGSAIGLRSTAPVGAYSGTHGGAYVIGQGSQWRLRCAIDGDYNAYFGAITAGEAVAVKLVLNPLTDTVTASVVGSISNHSTTHTFLPGSVAAALTNFTSLHLLHGAGGPIEFDNITLTAVPEPNTVVLLGLGGLTVVACGRRRRRRNL